MKMVSFGKLATFALIALAISVAIWGPASDPSKQTRPQPVAGWDKLDECSPLQSLDGKRELVLFQDHSAKIDNASGNWTFDEAAERYFIKFEGQMHPYTIVQPENSEVCILVRGDMSSANMRESWYGRTIEDLRDDAAEASR